MYARTSGGSPEAPLRELLPAEQGPGGEVARLDQRMSCGTKAARRQVRCLPRLIQVEVRHLDRLALLRVLVLIHQDRREHGDRPFVLVKRLLSQLYHASVGIHHILIGHVGESLKRELRLTWKGGLELPIDVSQVDPVPSLAPYFPAVSSVSVDLTSVSSTKRSTDFSSSSS